MLGWGGCLWGLVFEYCFWLGGLWGVLGWVGWGGFGFWILCGLGGVVFVMGVEQCLRVELVGGGGVWVGIWVGGCLGGGGGFGGVV